MSEQGAQQKCSFCDRQAKDVLILIAGLRETFICDACVDFSHQLVAHHRYVVAGKTYYVGKIEWPAFPAPSDKQGA